MTQASQYPRVTQHVTLGKSESSSTQTDIVPNFVPLTVTLTRMAWERVALVGILLDGIPVPATFQMGGDEQVFELPETDPNVVRRLELQWVNRSKSSVQFSFTLSEAPLEVQIARPVPSAPASPQRLPLAPAPAPMPNVPKTFSAPALSPVAVADPAARGGMVHAQSKEAAQRAAMPSALPSAPRVMGPPPHLAGSTGKPPTELEIQIAQAFGIRWEAVRIIAGNLAQNVRLSADELLEFLGPDGRSTCEPEWLESSRRDAVRANLNPGEYQLSQILFGVAKTISERKEFDELLAQAGAKPAVAGQDFKVTSATVGADGAVRIVEQTPAPRATGAGLKAIAERLSVQPEWLLVAVKSIADLRAMKPDELVALATPGVLVAASTLVEPELAAALAVEEPHPDSDAARFRQVAPELQVAVRAQLLATRCLDWIARQHQQGAF